MTKPFKVSQSKIKTYKRCHRAYWYKYVEKLTRKRKARPLQFGSIIHDMLEAYANGDDPFLILENVAKTQGKMFLREKELYGDIIEDIRTIMSHYFEYWPEESVTYLRRGMKCAEHEFNVEIAPNIIATGKIDAVIKTPNKLKWLMEHKSFTKLPGEDQRWRNLQSVVYQRIIEMQGWWKDLSGICWNYIGSKPPSKPKILKSGKLSTKSTSTLPGVIEKTILENKLKLRDYRPLIETAEVNQKDYFVRVFTPVNKKVVDNIFAGFIDSAKELAQTHGTKKDMNIDLHCNFCDYEPICRAELTGSDVDFIKQREYIKDEKRLEEKTKDI